MCPKCHRIELIFINPFFTYGLPCHKIEFLGLYKIWTARQSIPVIHFVTSFLPLDFQTPSSSPTPGKYNVFYFNFFNVSSGANFSWVCPKLHRIALIFVNPIFHDQSLSYWYLFIIELNSCMSQSRTRWISYELIPSASLLTSLHFNTCTFSSIFLLTSSPFNRKTSYSPTCVKRSLTRNGSMTVSYRLTAMQIPQNRGIMKND